MCKPEELLYFQDIVDSIKKIKQYTKKMSFDNFTEDNKTVDAVVRNLEIIGEAARYITKTTRQRHPEIPWAQMAGMRNKVIHEYSGVDLSILWQTVKDDIPDLKKKIAKILQ
ncbi:MAG: DUF86 domain-containing protein [Patescibacteria group bacterium]